MPPLGTSNYLSPGGWGCQKILGRITQFSVVTERGSEYNIVEREDSGKLTASGEGGEESDKFYWIQPKPFHPPPLPSQ